MMNDPDVLVVGAGPSGLATALQAHDHGARVRVVERREEAFRPSRAMIVHPRTLESLRPLGVADDLLARADTHLVAQLHVGGRHIQAHLADVAWRDTSFPHLTLVRQADVEEVLAHALDERGVEVERGVQLVDGESSGPGAVVRLRSRERSSGSVRCRFVVGCDGPDSTVRRIAGIGWRGGPYQQEIVLGDLELDGALPDSAIHVAAGRKGLVFLFARGGACDVAAARDPAGR